MAVGLRTSIFHPPTLSLFFLLVSVEECDTGVAFTGQHSWRERTRCVFAAST